jgi:enamine deaminase RidA (YjgF/YER057c/UK114 family)
VGQPPADGHPFAVEAWILSRRNAGEKILDREAGGTVYRVVESPRGREIHVALSGAASARGTRRQAESAFRQLKAVLSAESLAFSDIVRQWNYIEGIVDQRPGQGSLRQNYQVFNDVRTAFYASADFRRGYPAATGIGMNRGGVVVEGLALAPGRARLRIVPLSNPLQQDAHRYSQEVLAGRALSGMERKGTPKFERAKLVAEGDRGIIFISGTAAIRGQATVLENPAGQARTTLDNIKALISRSNLEAHGRTARKPGRIEYLRVYIKRPEDARPVREVVQERLPGVSALYVISDVCRPELLVEIEGIARLDPD